MEEAKNRTIIEEGISVVSLGQYVTYVEFFNLFFEGQESFNAKKGIVSKIGCRKSFLYNTKGGNFDGEKI